MRFGLIGCPLGHSLSPRIHGAISRLLDRAAEYDLLETAADQLEGRMEEIRRKYDGVNVTIPYKEAVLPYLDEISPEARQMGAVNTIAVRDGRLIGYNTDCDGFIQSLRSAGLAIQGAACTILGTGGAARAVLTGLAMHKAASLTVISRDPGRAEPSFLALAERLGAAIHSYRDLPMIKGDILINTTPVGMWPHTQESPIDEGVIASYQAAVDLIYNPAETRFLEMAKQAGKPAVNGLYMLAAQAAGAREIWENQAIPPAVVRQICAEMEGL